MISTLYLWFTSAMASCVYIFTMLFGLGICWSGFIKWGRARQDRATSLRAIHYAEAWSRVLLSFCIMGASLVALAVTNADGDIPTANTIMNAFFVPAIVFGLVSIGLMAVRYILMARNPQSTGQRQATARSDAPPAGNRD